MQIFNAVIGKPLSFTYVDINWGYKEWPDSVRAFTTFARDARMPVGIIYNAAPPSKTITNEEWLNDAQRNLHLHRERTLGIVANWAMFTSWVKFPGRALRGECPGRRLFGAAIFPAACGELAAAQPSANFCRAARPWKPRVIWRTSRQASVASAEP
jgi:hypothetical protein